MVITSEGRIATATKVNNRAPLFTLGFMLAMVAFVGVFLLGRVASTAVQGNLVVVVAARDIAPRESIGPDAIALQRLPSNAVPPQALVKLADVRGRAAQIRIPRGQAITANMVTDFADQTTGPGPAFLPIPQGDVAFTLPTNEQQGVGGYVAAGDYIDVVATINTAVLNATPSKVVTATVFRHVHVIRVGPPTAAGKSGQQQGVSSSLTVVISQCEAEVLDWLLANASLRYVLESYKDYQPATGPPPTACPSNGLVGPAHVDSLFGFTKA
jgi:pilus assembly protein CpaB